MKKLIYENSRRVDPKNECQIWNYHTKIGVENFELIEEEIPTEKTLSSVNVVVY